MSAGLDRTLAALADPHRRQVIDLLGRGPRPAGELAREVGLPAPAMSRALRALREVGLVELTHPPHDARVRIYELRPGPMRELKAWLEASEDLWSAQLAAFKAHLESGASTVASRILVALRVDAAPARAFRVFTEDIGLWWRPNGMFAFTPRDPGVLSFDGGEGGRLITTLAGGKVFEIGRIKNWTPPERLVFSWRQATFAADQDTEVEVRFEAVGDQTRVTVEHRGWDTVPAAHVARHNFPDAIFLRRHGEWWQALLGALNAFMRSTGKGA